MANKMRWRFGETNSVMLDVKENHIIESGDLVVAINGKAKPLLAATDQGIEPYECFGGVAMQCSTYGAGEAIRVATSGVFEFAIENTDLNVGDKLTFTEDYRSQEVRLAGAEEQAIGTCCKRNANNTEAALIDITTRTE